MLLASVPQLPRNGRHSTAPAASLDDAADGPLRPIDDEHFVAPEGDDDDTATTGPSDVSFMSANYVGDASSATATADEWGPCDERRTRPSRRSRRSRERFEGLLATIASAGFDALDLWTAHLNWRWATPEHVRIARAALDAHGLQLVSLAGRLRQHA